MKYSCLRKLIITECSHCPTQFKKIRDALPVLCADKGFRIIYDVIHTYKELINTSHVPIYPDATLWSRTVHVKIDLVDQNTTLVSSARLIFKVVTTKTHVFDMNMQKKFMLEYDIRSKSSHKNGVNSLLTRRHS